MSVIIRSVKRTSKWNITLTCAHGHIRLATRQAVLTAIGHTGYEWWHSHNESYLNQMLVGRFAMVDKIRCKATEEFQRIQKDRTLYSARFRIHVLKSTKPNKSKRKQQDK